MRAGMVTLASVLFLGAVAGGYVKGRDDARAQCHESNLAAKVAAQDRIISDLSDQAAAASASEHDTEAERRAISDHLSHLQASARSILMRPGCELPEQALRL